MPIVYLSFSAGLGTNKTRSHVTDLLLVVPVTGLQTRVGSRVWVARVWVWVCHDVPVQNPHPAPQVWRVFPGTRIIKCHCHSASLHITNHLNTTTGTRTHPGHKNTSPRTWQHGSGEVGRGREGWGWGWAVVPSDEQGFQSRVWGVGVRVWIFRPSKTPTPHQGYRGFRSPVVKKIIHCFFGKCLVWVV